MSKLNMICKRRVSNNLTDNTNKTKRSRTLIKTSIKVP